MVRARRRSERKRGCEGETIFACDASSITGSSEAAGLRALYFVMAGHVTKKVEGTFRSNGSTKPFQAIAEKKLELQYLNPGFSAGVPRIATTSMNLSGSM